jgi:hypothetical protein
MQISVLYVSAFIAKTSAKAKVAVLFNVGTDFV